jgi:hypothetical protein
MIVTIIRYDRIRCCIGDELFATVVVLVMVIVVIFIAKRLQTKNVQPALLSTK